MTPTALKECQTLQGVIQKFRGTLKDVGKQFNTDAGALANHGERKVGTVSMGMKDVASMLKDVDKRLVKYKADIANVMLLHQKLAEDKPTKKVYPNYYPKKK